MKFGILNYHDIQWKLLAKIPCSFCGSFKVVDDGKHPRCQEDNCDDGQHGETSAQAGVFSCCYISLNFIVTLQEGERNEECNFILS